MKSIAQLITEGREQLDKDSSWAADWLHRNWADIEATLEASRELLEAVEAVPYNNLLGTPPADVYAIWAAAQKLRETQ